MPAADSGTTDAGSWLLPFARVSIFNRRRGRILCDFERLRQGSEVDPSDNFPAAPRTSLWAPPFRRCPCDPISTPLN